VVGPGGEEIYTDEYARVRVHFHWDRESAHDERSSCWLPTNQPWAGKAYGAINLPRIGQEVLVEFLAGDPDRPVVIGRVYTEPNPPPDPLPKYKNVSGLFSEATPRMVMGAADGSAAGANLSPLGGTPMTAQQIHDTVTQPGPFQAVSPTGTNHQWAGSGLKIDDTSMAENLYIQANMDLHMVVWQDWKTVIGNSRATKIGTDDFTKIEGSQGIRVDDEQRTTVKNDCKAKVHGKRTDKVGKRMTQESQGDIVAESSYGNLVIGAKGVIRIESDEKIQLQSTDTGWQGTKSLVTIGPNDITFLAGTNKIEINPRGDQTPSESVGGIWLTPAEQTARDQAAAEQEAAAAAGREERLEQGRAVMEGLPRHWQPTANGENAFARQALRDAGITHYGEQSTIIDNYLRRNSLDMQ
jgi:type VI secretion system secreted protein VgrG